MGIKIKLPKDREIKIPDLRENSEMATPREGPEFEVKSLRSFGDGMISFK